MSKILVIDDEKYIREWYSAEFHDEGYEVCTAASRHQLLKRISAFKPDVIILDIRMIDCDGLELLQEIRESCHDLGIVICSAYDSYKYDIRAVAADYYVIKSFDLTKLKTAVLRVLEAKIPCETRAIA